MLQPLMGLSPGIIQNSMQRYLLKGLDWINYYLNSMLDSDETAKYLPIPHEKQYAVSSEHSILINV